MMRHSGRRTIAAAIVATGLGGAAGADASSFTAGAGKAVVTISPDMLPIEKFTSLHDALMARVVLLGSGGTRAAIAEVDLPSVSAQAAALIQKIVAHEASMDPANVWVVAGHSFSTPHMSIGFGLPGQQKSADELARGKRYDDAVLEAVTRAADQATQNLKPARLRFGTGISNVNVNRNVLTPEGWGLGANDAGPSDKSLGVVGIDSLDGQPMIMLLNYAVQSAVFEPARSHASGAATTDLGGAAARDVEQLMGGGVVSLFLTGADGDQVPAYTARRNVYDKDGHVTTIDVGDQGYLLLDVQAERVSTDAVRIAAAAGSTETPQGLGMTSGAVQLDTQVRPKNLWEIRPTKSYDFTLTGKADAPYYLMRIGDMVLVGVQVEFSAVTGMDLKRRSPFPNTLVLSMVNGAAKYLPDAQSFRNITYEAVNSSYGPGSAEILEEKILQDLQTLHRGMTD